MQKYLFSAILGVIILILAACGGDDPTAVPASGSTSTGSTSTGSTSPVATTAPAVQAPASATLSDIAAKLAGGPGAIYVGDVSQLAGPAPGEGLGDGTGNVPLDLVTKNSWIFQTDYYQSLLEKAKFTDPTELTSSGEEVDIQYACINRALLPCVLQIEYFAKNILARTDGQVNFEVSSYPELGLAGSDMIDLIQDGTISFAQIQPAYVGGTMPLIDIIYIWGLWKDSESEHLSNTALLTTLDKAMESKTGGGKLIYHIWYGGNDQFFFSSRPLLKPADFAGMKSRSHGTTMTDYINGLGGEGQFMAFAEVYTALERGILDAGVTGGHAGFGQRWYEVTKYLVGPAISMPMGFETMNKDVWEGIPADLQNIIIEEGAKMELENLRLAAVWNETAVSVNTDAGMTYQPYDEAMLEFIYNDVTLGRVLPNWIKRVGPTEIALFNEKVAPFAGVNIGADGSITQGGVVAMSGSSSPTASALADIAANLAGGPGAIYVGDIGQLVGPSFSKDYGDADGNVTLGSLERHLYMYESDYYKALLKKANFEHPTQLVSEGVEIEIQHACLNRAFVFCELSDVFLFPNVLERTNGQLKLVSSSYPELGLAGPDILNLLEDGTLAMAQIIAPYVAGDVPSLEIQYLFGIFPDREVMYLASTDMVPDLEKVNSEATGGGKVIYFSWSSGDDIFVSSKTALRTAEDIKGLNVRAFGTAIADWIIGMGAKSQFVAFSEVYTAMERGIIEAAISGGAASYGQRWYEVADYLNGPLVSFPNTVNVINKKVWEGIPPDLQAILIEEGAKYELEALRVAASHNEIVITQLVEAGMEYVEFSPEVRALSDKAVLEVMVPNWVKRVGGADASIVKVFNEKVGPRVGMHIEPDGSVVKTAITITD